MVTDLCHFVISLFRGAGEKKQNCSYENDSNLYIINHTSWVAVVTLTDCPKSVHNRCVIELFVALFMLSLSPYDISVTINLFISVQFVMGLHV